MRVLFINPSLRLGSHMKHLPPGIGSVMTYVKQNGYDFDLLDVDVNDYGNGDVEDFIAKNQYDVILSGAIVTHYHWMKWMTRTVRKHHPQTRIVIGNSVAGSIPQLFLTHSAADVAVAGEGEITTFELLNALRDGTPLHDIEGIAFLDGGTFVETPRRKGIKDVDQFPMIDWDLFDVDRYFQRSMCAADGLTLEEADGARTMPVITARGCVFRCTFCHFVFWDDPYRYRSPQSILAEVRRNIGRYGASYMNFWDDLSFGSLKQAERLADAILESDLEFNWNAAVRVDLFGDPRHPYEKRLEVARKFREAGCLNLGFSLESGSQEILNMMNKHITPQYFYDQVTILKDVGITCSTSVVFGYPLETRKTIGQTFDMCLRAGVYPSIGFLMPLPRTGMYEYAREHGFIQDENAYLDAITERQDFTLNMTSMETEKVMECIKQGAWELNQRLGVGLDEDHLIRTGNRQNKKRDSSLRMPIDPDNMERNRNDMSFNYSEALFDIDLGLRNKKGPARDSGKAASRTG
jgi:radical SAM superfamily enzyme YgiQ (UPF0313 family)